jgi:hypothetical protein
MNRNTVLLVLGWAIARFGAFHIKPEVPANPTLNYIGVSLAAISGFFYLFVKNETNTIIQEEQNLIIDENNFENIEEIRNVNNDESGSTSNNNTFIDRLNPVTKRLVGTSMSLLAGVLYAFTFTPTLYIQDNYDHASKNALDYVFSLYTGIYIVSISYFTLYCMIKKNKPNIYPKVILPGLISGLMWLVLEEIKIKNFRRNFKITLTFYNKGHC